MPKLKFWHAPEKINEFVKDLIYNIPSFKHIDPDRVHIIFSNSRTRRTIACCHAFSKRIQFALDIEPHYVIELIKRHWNRLDEFERAKVLIHELYHIPRTFSGNLRNHNCNFRSSSSMGIERTLMETYLKKHTNKTEQEVKDFIRKSMLSVL